MTSRRLAAALLLPTLLLLASTAQAQEWGGRLSVPRPRGHAVLETAAGLSRPVASGTGPNASGARRPEPELHSDLSPMQLAGVEVRVGGELGAALRSLISTDLAYVREVRVEDSGELSLEGSGVREGDGASVELTLRQPGGGMLRRSYRGPEAGVARFVHAFVDEAVGALTGRRSAFDSRIAFARRIGAGRKDVFTADADGSEVRRVSAGDGVAMLPSLEGDSVWYTVVTPTGTFITRSGLDERPVIHGPGVHMGPAVCEGRLYFSSSREGNSDIWSSARDGTDLRRLTTSQAIEVSPTCTPEGRIAFVSDRTGSPQIWIMDADGTGTERLTDTPFGAQTPALCGDLLAFTGVGGGMPMRVVVMDRRTGALRRISPQAGSHKDPAFSPDCRMLAWISPRGIEVATVDGRLRRVVVEGPAETVRWGRNAQATSR